jgi:nicotinamide-nucleotide amidase
MVYRLFAIFASMQSEIITIGDELVTGLVADTNSAAIARRLNLSGLKVSRITSIPDRKENILAALENIRTDTSLVIATGGLGPTSDDRTKEGLCAFFDTKLVWNEEVLANIRALLAKKGFPENASNREQALVPAAAKVLTNEIGTAPGLLFQKGNTSFIFLPGVPFEMDWMMENRVMPLLQSLFELPPVVHKNVLTSGAFEAQLAELLKDFEKELPQKYSFAYLPSPGMIRLRLSCYEPVAGTIQEMNLLLEKLKPLIAEYWVGMNVNSLEEYCGRMLKDYDLSVSTAESCTGGYIASLITSVPGSSAWFKGSLVAYANEIKTGILGVEESLIGKYGAVSAQVVEAMAVNCRKLFKSDYCLATSGIAGPDGGSAEKPVGTVWISIASERGVHSRKFLFGDNRERNIRRSSYAALNILRKMIEDEREKSKNSIKMFD